MLTQAWVGRSAIETYRRLQEVAADGEAAVDGLARAGAVRGAAAALDDIVTRAATVFFAPFCLYHAQDGAPGGLSIDEQLDALLTTCFAAEAAMERLEA